MKLKIFTFRFSPDDDGFNDKAMQDFTRDKEVIEYTEHFFIHDKTPYLTVIISYRDLPWHARRKNAKKEDPRKELDQWGKTVFDALRAWRAVRAKQDGTPHYMIADNKQLAEMVRRKAKTKADLVAIKGIGDVKVIDYYLNIKQPTWISPLSILQENANCSEIGATHLTRDKNRISTDLKEKSYQMKELSDKVLSNIYQKSDFSNCPALCW